MMSVPETKMPSGDMWKESKSIGKVQIWACADADAVAKVKALAVRSAVEMRFFISKCRELESFVLSDL